MECVAGKTGLCQSVAIDGRDGVRIADAPARIERVAEALRRLGQDALAKELDEVVALLPRGVVPDPPGGVMTTGQAAEKLGIRSIATIRRWAMDGILDGYRRGGRMMVSADSVDRLLASSTVAAEKAHEAAQDAAFAPFDVLDQTAPQTSMPGKRPWAPEGA